MGSLFLDCLADLGRQADPSGSRWTVRRDLQGGAVVAALEDQIQRIEMMVASQPYGGILVDGTCCFLIIIAALISLAVLKVGKGHKRPRVETKMGAIDVFRYVFKEPVLLEWLI